MARSDHTLPDESVGVRYRRALAEDDALVGVPGASALRRILVRYRFPRWGDPGAPGGRAGLNKLVSSGPIKQALDEMETLDKAVGRGLIDAATARGYRAMIVASLAETYLKGQVAFPANHYHVKYGIPPSRLRKAKFDGRLTPVQVNGTPQYLFAEVARLWPQDVLDAER